MILDYLANADRYVPMHPGLAAGFAFLRSAGLAALPDGKHPIDGDRLFVMIARGEGQGREKSLLESHRRYLDIQYVIAGEDCIGWRPLADCERVSTPYDAEKEVGFFFDRPDTWLIVPSGAFTIFYPEDAHAPMAGDGANHKAVVKVALEW